MKQNNEEKRKPFFAEFLENQVSEEQTRSIQGGDTVTSVIPDQAQTMKYPSDQEDNPQTKKYPSDCEDDTTKPAADLYQTMKYPSDNDESGIPV